MRNDTILVVVLEDEEKDCARLKSHIKRYSQEHSVDIEIVTFQNGLDLLKNYSGDFDILFVDIEIPGMDGMKVSEKVRQIDALIPIIITTNMAQYAIKGYEVDALGFIVKPLPFSMLSYYLARALTKCQRNKKLKQNSVITITTASGSMKQLYVDEIRYVVKEKNYIVYDLRSGEQIKERGTMKDIIPRFENTTLKQCTSGCLINLRYIEQKVGNEVYLSDTVFSIAMPFRKTFTKELMDYVRGM